MNKRNGFTLVELIAVIAILGVILLLVTPNVIKTLSGGKKDAFIRQVQSIWREAEKEFTVDFAKSRKNNVYCDKSHTSIGCKSLSVNKNKVLYVVGVDNGGDVNYIAVGDKNFCYIASEPTTMRINSDNVYKSELTCDEDGCYCNGNLTEYPSDFESSYSGDNNGGGSGTVSSGYKYWFKAYLRMGYEVPVGSFPEDETLYDDPDYFVNHSSVHQFIRSKVNRKGESTKHAACITLNGRYACFDYDYWLDAVNNSSISGTQAEKVLYALENDLTSIMGMRPDDCEINSDGVRCYYRPDYSYEYYFVEVRPGGGTEAYEHGVSSSGTRCSVYDNTGTAECYSW